MLDTQGWQYRQTFRFPATVKFHALLYSGSKLWKLISFIYEGLINCLYMYIFISIIILLSMYKSGNSHATQWTTQHQIQSLWLPFSCFSIIPKVSQDPSESLGWCCKWLGVQSLLSGPTLSCSEFMLGKCILGATLLVEGMTPVC